MTTVDLLHQVKLIDGDFTPSEASDVLSALIREKINFHKLHRLSMCEGNIYSDTSFDDSRVAQLSRAKAEFDVFCQEARSAGKKIRINGILDVEIID